MFISQTSLKIEGFYPPSLHETSESKAKAKIRSSLFGRAFRLAKHQCANYQHQGPYQKPNYCWAVPEAYIPGKQCLLSLEQPCKWFREAVLPLDRDLQKEWATLFIKPEPDSIPEIFKKCSCGKHFKPRSNRQRLCPECSVQNRKKLNRENVKKSKAKKQAVR